MPAFLNEQLVLVWLWPLFPPSVSQLNPAGLLTMPRSPTSSEDEMAQSFSDYSDDCASDSSREETIYETIRATAEPSQSRMDDIHINSLVVRILIPDLQQTVSICDTNVECGRMCGGRYEIWARFSLILTSSEYWLSNLLQNVAWCVWHVKAFYSGHQYITSSCRRASRCSAGGYNLSQDALNKQVCF